MIGRHTAQFIISAKNGVYCDINCAGKEIEAEVNPCWNVCKGCFEIECDCPPGTPKKTLDYCKVEEWLSSDMAELCYDPEAPQDVPVKSTEERISYRWTNDRYVWRYVE
jgi:hypothetical protein